MKKIIAILFLLQMSLFAQNQWTLQPWMQVIGKYNGQNLGTAVSYLGKKNDSTLISVSDGNNNIYIYKIKSPRDTVPIYTFKGVSCLTGDFNGDGIPDLVVTGNPTRIYLGKSPGVYDTTAFFVKYSDPDGDNFGNQEAVGNINGDNYTDLVIADVGPNIFKGKVYVFFGGVKMDTIPAYTLNGDSKLSFFGWNVACGDLNNDGYDDIIVKGYDQSTSGPHGTIGIAYIKIFLGGKTIDTTAWKYIIGGDNSGLGLAAFDVNGDGVKDLLWTNYYPKDSIQSVYVHYSHNGDIDTTPSIVLPNNWASNLANAGNMNGDGYNDILISDNSSDQSGNSYIFEYSGGPKMDTNFDAAVGLEGGSNIGAWGSITGIGDINGDGLDDILVGAPQYQWFEPYGYWGIYLGSKKIPYAAVNQPNNTLPKTFELFQNYPNPFNPSTVLSWQLTSPGKVTVSIYNTLGQKLQELVNEEQSSGVHSVTFKAKNYASGTYFYRLTVRNENGQMQSMTKEMVLLK
jgi:hypothetical protein